MAQPPKRDRITRIGVSVAVGRSWLPSATADADEQTRASTSDAIALRLDHDVRPRLTVRLAVGLSSRDADASRFYDLPTALRLRTSDLIGGIAWTAWRRGRLRLALTTEAAVSSIDSLDVLSLDKQFVVGSLSARSTESSVIFGTELLVDMRYPVALALAYRHGLTVFSEPFMLRARSVEARVSVYPFAR